MKRIKFCFITAIAFLTLCIAPLYAQNAQSTTKAAATSSLWNGDIPAAEIIYSYFYKGSSRYESMLKSHGYELTDNVTTKTAVKPGVCKMEFKFTSTGAELQITLDNTDKQQWLVKSIEKYIVSDKELDSFYHVTSHDNIIDFNWVTNL